MAKKKVKKVLVTGGGGFIGSHLINNLRNRGHSVSCLDRSDRNLPKGTPYFEGDILDEKVVGKAMVGQDVVYHLAGVLGTSELQEIAPEATRINVIGALNVFNEAVKNGTKVVLISKPNPWLNTYSITKETSEKFLQMYRKEFGLKGCVVKWFSVFGPGQKHYGVQKAVPTFIVAALQNKPIPVYGDGRQIADFIYVSDVCDLTVTIAEDQRSEGKTFEAGTGRGTSVNRLAKVILEEVGGKSGIKHLPMRMGEDKGARVVADLGAVRKLYNFSPKMSFREGIRETIDYYRELLSKDS